ncbi:MAG TPA: ribosomal protein S18-alanine N-acetyltransferase [Terracidiphilus sp.]|nr:ribosomal protein S18-alanine N-acetyltransferase [Terracidiphilus sp.]
MKSDNASIEIRPVNVTDLDEIIGIAEILAEAPHWPRKRYDEVLRADSPVRRIALVAADPQSREVVGFIIASLVLPEAELETIAVAPERQRQGIGARLLEKLVHELKAAGAEELHLEVRASNQPAIRFYRSENFRQTGVRPRYYVDPEEDAVLMSLRLE